MKVNKRSYTSKQICEAIQYWTDVLHKRMMNESKFTWGYLETGSERSFKEMIGSNAVSQIKKAAFTVGNEKAGNLFGASYETKHVVSVRGAPTEEGPLIGFSIGVMPSLEWLLRDVTVSMLGDDLEVSVNSDLPWADAALKEVLDEEVGQLNDVQNGDNAAKVSFSTVWLIKMMAAHLFTNGGAPAFCQVGEWLVKMDSNDASAKLKTADGSSIAKSSLFDQDIGGFMPVDAADKSALSSSVTTIIFDVKARVGGVIELQGKAESAGDFGSNVASLADPTGETCPSFSRAFFKLGNAARR